MTEPQPSPADELLAEQLQELKVQVYAMRAALQAVIAATPCSIRTLEGFDAAAAQVLTAIALETAQRPHWADRDAQDALRKCIADWRWFLSPPERSGPG